MSVYVVLLMTAVPAERAEEASRTVSFEDRAGEETPFEYQYSVHGSGALVVWRCPAVGKPVVDMVYGPASWESVDGDLHRTL